MLQTYTAHQPTHTADRTPTEVNVARSILVGQGALVLLLGVVLCRSQHAGVQALGIASIGEGALRVVLGVLLRRGARGVRRAALVVAGIGAVVGALAGGLSFLGAALSVIVVRCLCTPAAKRHLGVEA
jgi:hypothetical protein